MALGRRWMRANHGGPRRKPGWEPRAEAKSVSKKVRRWEAPIRIREQMGDS